MRRINRNINNMQVRDIRRICDMTLRWCKDNFGVNHRRRKPISISVELSHSDGDAYGMYMTGINRIYIYLDHTKTIRQLVSTIIHEYIHSLQPIDTHYKPLMKKHKYYSRHPFERQAVYYETKYAPICWEEIKQGL